MTHAEAWERFDRWFRADGHWIYRSRAHAIDTWKRIGIFGVPDFPKGYDYSRDCTCGASPNHAADCVSHYTER